MSIHPTYLCDLCGADITRRINSISMLLERKESGRIVSLTRQKNPERGTHHYCLGCAEHIGAAARELLNEQQQRKLADDLARRNIIELNELAAEARATRAREAGTRLSAAT